VQDEYNGFVFKGDSLQAQVDGLVQTVSKAVALRMNQPDEWRKICQNAADARFNWRDSAALYIEKLYRRSKKSKKKKFPARDSE